MHRLNRLVLLGSSLVILGACAVAGARSAPAGAGHGMASDSASAHRAAIGFLAAFDSLQWEPFRAYLADDITMFFPFAQVPTRADGRLAVESVFSQFMNAQRTARAQAGRPMVQGLAPRDLRVQMLGPGGAVASFHLGNEAPARRSVVFRRTAGGEWKVVHWHASPSPRPSGS
jgi:hypothetical protein